ncbi:MAG: Na+/H+ antiporter NhaC family protein [Flavobacteriales bacterium]|nr:Na+/H+ antiporter NhaC family protein [Flavobacteriales bacterium]MCB9448906.1 Na+/H+ antiporter NhaC family protein [Flavobacteriales bacterium]
MQKRFSPIHIILLVAMAWFHCITPARALNFEADQFEVTVPDLIVADMETSIEIHAKDLGHPDLMEYGQLRVTIGDQTHDVDMSDDGKAVVTHVFSSDDEELSLSIGAYHYQQPVHPMPLWLSILPPLLAIVMALIFREVISSLFVGILFGASVLGFYTKGIMGIFSGFLAVIDTYLIRGLSNEEHAAIIIFSLTIGGMVGIISKNGGMQGVVNRLSKYASTRKSGQFVTWFLGVAVFFDDYANSLVVGNTMRPITDKLKISREKLSYLVDSTAAPVAAVAFITTWIGAELSYISSGTVGTGIKESSYSIFFSSLQYSFYPVFTLVFMLFLILRNRDFGPMLKAEKRAVHHGEVESDKSRSLTSAEMGQFEPLEGIKHSALNAVVPILVLVGGAIIGLLYTGMNATYDALLDEGIQVGPKNLGRIFASMDMMESPPGNFFQKLGVLIGNADSYAALLWSSLSSAATAMLLSLGQRLMNLETCITSMVNGFKSMFHAILTLLLAWSLAAVTSDMHTADFITGSLLSSGIPPTILPSLTFLMACVIAFSTGSSWGTMAILYPLVLAATWSVCQAHGYDMAATLPIFHNVTACVLAGAVLGDHCSPISDTTILSSLASSCNHIDHVRTQLPYAMVVGATSLLFGTLPSGLGLHPAFSMLLGLGVLWGVVQFWGKKVE